MCADATGIHVPAWNAVLLMWVIVAAVTWYVWLPVNIMTYCSAILSLSKAVIGSVHCDSEIEYPV